MRVADAALCSNFFPLSFRSLISFSIDKVRVNILSLPAGYITHTKKKREERREKMVARLVSSPSSRVERAALAWPGLAWSGLVWAWGWKRENTTTGRNGLLS